MLYVMCELCVMCVGVMSVLGVREVVYGCANDKFGGAGIVFDVYVCGCGVCGGVGGVGKLYDVCGGLFECEVIEMF